MRFTIILTYYYLFFFTCLVHSYIDRPVIGVLSTPTTCCKEPICLQNKNESEYSYIDSAYVDFLRLSGARIAPVLFDWTEDEINKAYPYLNGLLVPGGGCNFGNIQSQYMKTLNLFFQRSKLMDEYFPIWGTDEGLISLIDLITDDQIQWTTNLKTTLPLGLNIVKENSKILEFATDDILSELQKDNITYQSSTYGVAEAEFNQTEILNDFYDIVTTSIDGNGKKYVSMIEAKVEPVFGVSFNPEKILFQYKFPSDSEFEDGVVFSRTSLVANSYFSSFFVEMCRRSNHTYFQNDDTLLNSVVIENYTPVFTQKSCEGEDAEKNYMTRIYFLPKFIEDDEDENQKERILYLISMIVISVSVCCCVCCCITICCIVDKIYLWFFRKDNIDMDQKSFEKLKKRRDSKRLEENNKESYFKL